MKSNELVKLLNVPDSTLRRYAQEYAEYLSPVAGGAGHHRDYSEQDARILRLILDMKGKRTKPADIDVTLSSLRAGNWERLPALDEASKSLIPTPDALITAGLRESALQSQIDLLREMLEKATTDRDELLRRLSRAETLLELYQQGQLKPPAHE